MKSTAVYEALRSEQPALIDAQIKSVQVQANSMNNAYLGALMMKKAGLLKKPDEKIKLFRQGKEKLEKEIKQNDSNIEFRFLRLLIQENAPKILQYHDALKDDAAVIGSGYKELKNPLKHEILNYSKTSEVLTPEKLNE